VQWQASQIASQNAQSTVGFFHWSFLANTELANKMITAYGGANWCVDMIDRWAGSNSQGLDKLKSDTAMEVYGGFMTESNVIAASCEDYKHGATTDVEAQEEDQKEGKKIDVPVLLLYGKDFIGKKWDMAGVWREWMSEEAKLSEHGFGGGIGHFGAEEAPEECARVLREWMERLKRLQVT
jgi:pimeloyl-ACP methyl ester carboxylesterase